ncbi:Endonuclease V [Filimonas lacunae]|uniref:Endonuclease V n=2 Tax=Filimonas lacunae TaxID=477680 RepID=A0A173MEA4_9BACT|nr:endonuclease V [Filimonas lacunae]SIT28467.1 Endonuclease V [Filimonas lacunae]
MIYAFDSYYYDDKAKTVGIVLDSFTAASPAQVYTEIKEGIEAYEPGAFYKRELPCIASLLQQMPATLPQAIIIDGFVVLDDEGNKGLGGYVFELLEGKVPVIGVAKTDYAGFEQLKRAVLRGESQRPLFVSALGMDIDTAAAHIKSMYGEFRIPQVLKELDTLTKQV